MYLIQTKLVQSLKGHNAENTTENSLCFRRSCCDLDHRIATRASAQPDSLRRHQKVKVEISVYFQVEEDAPNQNLATVFFSVQRMFIVGLTGGISTGKSTVSQMFRELGCPIVDADVIAREVVEPGTNGWKKIHSTFGDEVFNDDGTLDRGKLGMIIFADKEKRTALNRITHPEIQKAMLWKLLLLVLRGHQFAILDTPLLFESNKMVPYMAFTIVVSCSPEQQLSRLQARNQLSTEEATQRINSQMPLDEKCRLATFVIDNSGDIENTKRQVLEIHRTLCNSRRHWKLRLALFSVIIVFVSVIGYLVVR